jgi:5-methylcytosine-specific restriction endonuclease McrA
MIPCSWSEAKLQGADRFYTGRPCKRGHVSERYTASRECVSCTSDKAKKRWAEKPDIEKQRIAAWRAENKARIVAYDAARRKIAWAENAPKLLSEQREYYKKNIHKKRAYLRAYYKKNARRLSKWWKEYRDKHPKKFRAKKRSYYERHYEVIIANEQTRRARLLNAKGRFTAQQIRDLARKQGYICAACPKSIKAFYHRDHIIPLSRGGSNGIRNIQLLCARCNHCKYNKTPAEWVAHKSYMGEPISDHLRTLASKPESYYSEPEFDLLL